MGARYSGRLDDFELYHRIQENDARGPQHSSGNATALEALGHAIAGSVGAAVSNALLYPVDLIITRLQIQRQLRKDQSQPTDDEYKGFVDAVEKIYKNEGGAAGLYTGLLQDTGKTVADAFLFFLTYSFLRDKRLARHGTKSLPALEELGVGFVAGGLTKLATTPIANVVTRKQAAALLAANDTEKQGPFKVPTVQQITSDILTEKGFSGFWSGYSASLVLTLNPSITFFLFETLKKVLLPRSRRDNPPPSLTFLLSAFSKACASSITYPFSLAKARLQAGGKGEDRDEKAVVAEDVETEKAQKAARATIFSTVLTIAQTEGVSALYEGLYVEVLRAFFSHGITMLVKQVIQKLLVRAYYITTIIVGRYKRRPSSKRMAERARASVEYYNLAMARASDKIEQAGSAIKQKANETAEFVGEYIEEENDGDWRELYGNTGLDRWLDRGRGEK